MNIAVLLKQTPDTEAKIAVAADGSIDSSGVKQVVNPYDEFAVEEAIKLKEAHSGEVVVITVGPEDAKERMLKALAMGADRGVLIHQGDLAPADSLATARVLAKAVEAEKATLVLCGKQGIDDDNMHVGPMVAELLGWPHVNVVAALTVAGETATVTREVEGGQQEVYEAQLPLVIGAHKSLNTPRYASLPGIMKAKRKPFEVKTIADLGLDGAALATGAKVAVKGYKAPAPKPPGKLFQGEPVGDMVAKVVGLLRDEAKVL